MNVKIVDTKGDIMKEMNSMNKQQNGPEILNEHNQRLMEEVIKQFLGKYPITPVKEKTYIKKEAPIMNFEDIQLLCLKTLKCSKTEYFTKGKTYPVEEMVSTRRPVVKSNIGIDTAINLDHHNFAIVLM
jgi:hypothetical protein